MYNSSNAGARRPVILYIIVAIALFAGLILAVRWAKSRADFYGKQQVEQGQTVATTEESQPQGASDESHPADSSHQQTQIETSTSSSPHSQASQSTESTPSATQTPRTVANTGPPVVHSVPATGAEQLVLPVMSVSAFVFAALSFVRSRRRFMAESLAK